MANGRVASFVLTAAAACLVLRVFGVGRDWLPSAAALALLLAAAHLMTVRSWQDLMASGRAAARTHAFALGMVLLVLIALAVRIPGFDSDLGHVPLDVDEHRFAANVKQFFVTGELGHETVEHYPGLVFWMFSAASFLSYVRELASGMTRGPAMLPVETFVQAARASNIVVGAGMVMATAWVGRQLSGRATGLLAGLIVAIVPLSVEVTRLARNDPGMVLVVTLTVGAALVCHRNTRVTWVVGAGVLAGLATAIKYSSVFALAPVLVATLASTGPMSVRARRAACAFAGFVAAVAVTNHFVWADFPRFLLQLSDQVAITGPGHWAASDNPAWVYSVILERLGPGLVWLLLAAGFAVYGLGRRRVDLWIFLSFPLVYVWFMTMRPSQLTRWVLPVLPFVAIAGSAALVAGVRAVQSATRWPHLDRRATHVVTTLLVIGSLAQPVWSGTVWFSRVTNEPTHAAVEAWMVDHAEPGSHVLLGDGWLRFDSARFVVRRVPDLENVLDGGVEQLAGCQWVVVPELSFGHPTLQRLSLMQRVDAGRSFGGREGLDYEVYAVPDLPFEGACQADTGTTNRQRRP